MEDSCVKTHERRYGVFKNTPEGLPGCEELFAAFSCVFHWGGSQSSSGGSFDLTDLFVALMCATSLCVPYLDRCTESGADRLMVSWMISLCGFQILSSIVYKESICFGTWRQRRFLASAIQFSWFHSNPGIKQSQTCFFPPSYLSNFNSNSWTDATFSQQSFT